MELAYLVLVLRLGSDQLSSSTGSGTAWGTSGTIPAWTRTPAGQGVRVCVFVWWNLRLKLYTICGNWEIESRFVEIDTGAPVLKVERFLGPIIGELVFTTGTWLGK